MSGLLIDYMTLDSLYFPSFTKKLLNVVTVSICMWILQQQDMIPISVHTGKESEAGLSSSTRRWDRSDHRRLCVHGHQRDDA